MSSRNVSASQAGAPRQQRPEGGEDRATVARVRVKEERRHAAEEVRGGGGLAGAAERGDVIEPLLVEVDQIYHLACPASPIFYKHNPVKTIKTNVIGTLNMLGLAKRVRARILLTSTSEVYGDPLEHPQTEAYWGNVNPIGVRSCYDEGKRVAETLMFDYHRQHGIEIRIARIFNTYGPRMNIDDGRVVSNFIAQAVR
ncbi:UDP-glucuronic acid decarboxylase 6 [Zea mays]|uniref:UDP-glucuronic acid decarboxylase 1 n=2 Tax=Zea mays TaxID=4577 RepID=A0A8J8XF29_MAIZE|nr:UDP-glucuronic acid decarboxylase 5 [Zea mays]PWZ55442.1 UDP-glucuronic acid decarboxylase 6 [Zea mays]